jgi:hypothetical protein
MKESVHTGAAPEEHLENPGDSSLKPPHPGDRGIADGLILPSPL